MGLRGMTSLHPLGARIYGPGLFGDSGWNLEHSLTQPCAELYALLLSEFDLFTFAYLPHFSVADTFTPLTGIIGRPCASEGRGGKRPLA